VIGRPEDAQGAARTTRRPSACTLTNIASLYQDRRAIASLSKHGVPSEESEPTGALRGRPADSHAQRTPIKRPILPEAFLR